MAEPIKPGQPDRRRPGRRAESVLTPTLRVFVRSHNLHQRPRGVTAVNMHFLIVNRLTEHKTRGAVFVARIILDDFSGQETFTNIRHRNHP